MHLDERGGARAGQQLAAAGGALVNVGGDDGSRADEFVHREGG